MIRRFGFAVMTLCAATSCTPPGHAPAVRQIVPLPAKLLLQRLDLNVPTDLLDRPSTGGAIGAVARAVAGIASVATAAPPFQAATQSIDDTMRAADCLTAAVYYEARSEPVDGQRAVAQVVLNRVRDRAFPASVCGVVYQGSQRRTGCQFSFTCDGSLYRPREPAAWDRARQVAAAALAGDVYAPVGSATFYHATSVLPWWASSLNEIGLIGRHVFYRWRNELERKLSYTQAYAGAEPVPVAGGRAAPALPFASANGATMSNGVTVHRGGMSQIATPIAPASAAALATAAPAVATVPAAAPRGRHLTLADMRPAGGTTTASGVRVHRGVEAPVSITPDAATTVPPITS